MPTQTTYSQTHLPAFVGQIATQLGALIASGVAEAAAGVPFGKPVVVGTGDGNVKVPAANGDNKFLGIAVRDMGVDHVTPTDIDKYLQGQNISYLTKGEIWVTVAENVADGDPVYFYEADGTFTKTAATNYTLIAGARYMTTATNGNLAKVRLG